MNQQDKPQLIVIFDGTCGFCTQTIDRIARLDRHDRIRAVPCQSREVTRFGELATEECQRRVVCIGSDGAIVGGGLAMMLIASTLLGSRLPYAVSGMPGIRSIIEWIYKRIATNRHRLPGVVPWCDQFPEDCRK